MTLGEAISNIGIWLAAQDIETVWIWGVIMGSAWVIIAAAINKWR